MRKKKKTPAEAPTAYEFESGEQDAISATECTGMIPVAPENDDALAHYDEVLSYLPPDPPARSDEAKQ